EIVPSYLATSPIMSAGEELMQAQLGRNASRHHDPGGGRREESGEDFSEDEDVFMIDMSSDEEEENDGSRYVDVNACLGTTGSTEKGI
ncbi:unnamed protein product, partial [Tetraodon nigroviridis]